MEKLSFQFPTPMTCSQHFCDITIVVRKKKKFKGHKVVLAACSLFLRDQFLFNPSSLKIQLSVLHNSKVVCDLLQSCYTGKLEFDLEELINYMTAASYLQMGNILEQCRGALRKCSQLQHLAPPEVDASDEEEENTT